jgi:hypothetical protein
MMSHDKTPDISRFGGKRSGYIGYVVAPTSLKSSALYDRYLHESLATSYPGLISRHLPMNNLTDSSTTNHYQ